MAFGAVLREGGVVNYARAIGGDMNTIWFGAYWPGSFYRLYELSTTDLSVVRYASVTASYYLTGVGGDANTIWGTTPYGAGKVMEYSTSDLSLSREAATSASNPSGCGGNANYIWHTSTTSNNNYRLSTVDFSIVAQLSSPSTGPIGIGGGSLRVWHRDSNTQKLYELTTQFAQTQNVSLSGVIANSGSVGGDDWTIWASSYDGKVYELDSGYTYYHTYPADTALRITGLRHVYRPGSYRLEATLGDVSTDTEVPKTDMIIKWEEKFKEFYSRPAGQAKLTVPTKSVNDVVEAIKQETGEALFAFESEYANWQAGLGGGPRRDVVSEARKLEETTKYVFRQLSNAPREKERGFLANLITEGMQKLAEYWREHSEGQDR